MQRSRVRLAVPLDDGLVFESAIHAEPITVEDRYPVLLYDEAPRSSPINRATAIAVEFLKPPQLS